MDRRNFLRAAAVAAASSVSRSPCPRAEQHVRPAGHDAPGARLERSLDRDLSRSRL